MKKTIYPLLGILVILSLTVTGCSAPTKDEQKPTEPVTVTEETVKPEEKPLPEINDLSEIFSKTSDFKNDGIHYTQVITAADQTNEMETWIKGDMMKSKILAEAEEIITITNTKSGDFITYYPSQKTGIKYNIKGSDTAELPEGAIRDIESYEDDIDPVKFEIVGRENIDGIDTVVIKTKDDSAEVESKMWVSEKYGIIMKMESVNSDGSNMKIEVKNFEQGNIPDSEFDVPNDIQIQEF